GAHRDAPARVQQRQGTPPAGLHAGHAPPGGRQADGRGLCPPARGRGRGGCRRRRCCQGAIARPPPTNEGAG
ncbi:hypothetical protein MNEG_16551, partial [Monoraphidium neglectum]